MTLDWLPELSIGDVTVHVDYVFVENTNDQQPNLEAYKLAIPEYFKDRKDLNMRISWANEDDTLEVGAWAKNLTDERYVESLGGLSAATLGTPFGRVNRGREIGIDLKYNF